MTLLDPLHSGYVHGRRVRVLVAHIAPLLPAGGNVLDVGAGDGHVAQALMRARPDVTIMGVDPLVRPATRIAVRQFDGRHIPFADESFDAVLMVDVLHHAEQPLDLLAEAVRVSHTTLIVKDHKREGFAAATTLKFMDAVGNKRHGVALPCNYLSDAEWRAAFSRLGLVKENEVSRLDLYPWPASLLFDRALHFVVALRRPQLAERAQLQIPTP